MRKFLMDSGLGRGPMWLKELDEGYERNNGYIDGDKWIDEDEMVGFLVTKGVSLWAEVEKGWAVPIYEGDARGDGVKVMFTGDGGGHFYMEWEDGVWVTPCGDKGRNKGVEGPVGGSSVNEVKGGLSDLKFKARERARTGSGKDADGNKKHGESEKDTTEVVMEFRVGYWNSNGLGMHKCADLVADILRQNLDVVFVMDARLGDVAGCKVADKLVGDLRMNGKEVWEHKVIPNRIVEERNGVGGCVVLYSNRVTRVIISEMVVPGVMVKLRCFCDERYWSCVGL
jgi:hypothetical protein